jgi:hypothetical protein
VSQGHSQQEGRNPSGPISLWWYWIHSGLDSNSHLEKFSDERFPAAGTLPCDIIRPMRANWLSRSNFFGVLLGLGLLAMTARNAVDPDLWWHLRTGQWIVETRSIPHTDPFSFTRAGSAWVSHEWLSEVAFFTIWKYAGFVGLVIFSAVITTAGFMFLYQRCSGNESGAGAAALVLGAVAAAPAWGVRPQMFTFALASVFLWLLDRADERPWLLLWVPPLFVLWLNLHAGFAFAPALLGAVGVGLLWEAAAGETSWRDVRLRLIRIGSLFLACLAMIPLNPSGAELYRYPLDVVRSAGMRSFINEWFPPDFHQLHYFPVFLVWVGLVWSLAGTPHRPKSRVLAPLFLTFVAALDAVRHIPLLILMAVPVISAYWAWLFSQRKTPPPTNPKYAPLRPAFRAMVLILMAGFVIARWSALDRKQAVSEAENFPVRAVDFLHSHTLPRHLFVYYDWGGYAIWRLYPDYRVFIDGRADLYGDRPLSQFRLAAEFKTGWRQVLDQAEVGTVLVPPTGALAEGLRLDPEWQTKYQDSRAILFQRGSDTPEIFKNTRNLPLIGEKK